MADDDRSQARRRDVSGFSALFFMAFGGLEAMAIRVQLMASGQSRAVGRGVQRVFYDAWDDDDLPGRDAAVARAFGNFMIPLQIGARDVAISPVLTP